MRLFISNNLVSLKGRSKISNEAGERVFKVEGKLFSLGNKKMVKDAEGNVLFVVKNKSFSLLMRRSYVLDSENKLVATVTRKTSFKSKYEVECADGSKIELDGDVFGFNYDIVKDGVIIGHVSKKLVALNDQFCLDVTDDKTADFLSALVIAIDNIQDRANDVND